MPAGKIPRIASTLAASLPTQRAIRGMIGRVGALQRWEHHPHTQSPDTCTRGGEEEEAPPPQHSQHPGRSRPCPSGHRHRHREQQHSETAHPGSEQRASSPQSKPRQHAVSISACPDRDGAALCQGHAPPPSAAKDCHGVNNCWWQLTWSNRATGAFRFSIVATVDPPAGRNRHRARPDRCRRRPVDGPVVTNRYRS